MLYITNYTGVPSFSTEVWTPTKAKIGTSDNLQKPVQSEEVKSNERNPNTSGMNIYELFIIEFVSGCGVVYMFKKRFN